jgi:hypothetical protein
MRRLSKSRRLYLNRRSKLRLTKKLWSGKMARLKSCKIRSEKLKIDGRTRAQTGYKHFQAKQLSTEILTILQRCKKMRSVSPNRPCRNMTFNMIWLCISNRSLQRNTEAIGPASSASASDSTSTSNKNSYSSPLAITGSHSSTTPAGGSSDLMSMISQ